MSLACHPELVHMERVFGNGKPLQRLTGLKNTYSGIWCYADYPKHYAGDARTASIEKGKVGLRLQHTQSAPLIQPVSFPPVGLDAASLTQLSDTDAGGEKWNGPVNRDGGLAFPVARQQGASAR